MHNCLPLASQVVPNKCFHRSANKMTKTRRLLPQSFSNIAGICVLMTLCNRVSIACLGYSSSSSPTGAGGNYLRSQSSSALARGAPNLGDGGEFRSANCQRADIGTYKAKELRHLATIYEFPVGKAANPMETGGQLSCNFDSVEENCAWYTVQMGPERKEIFRRARFESFFDWEKFDCTSDRPFTFEEFFLIVGGRENSLGQEVSATIESGRIPCQIDKALLKFDYWSNNDTPVLKICVLPEEEPIPQCESKMDANPLTFEIPESKKPFRLRIQIDHIVSGDEVAFIDNVQYDGKICKFALEESNNGRNKKTMSPRVMAPSSPISSSYSSSQLTTTSNHSTNPVPFGKEEEEEEGDNGHGQDAYSDEVAEGGEELDEEKTRTGKTELHEGQVHLGQGKKANAAMPDDAGGQEALCLALTCDFNSGHSCAYNLTGLGRRSQWKIGNGPIGNPHTGIHKGGPKDRKLAGYAYVLGGLPRQSKDQFFAMKSPQIELAQPLLMTFDLFHRSVGPELKVCLNSLQNCPYTSPSKPNTSKPWLTEQRVILRRGTEKVYFVASKLRQNLYLAVDNIRLQTIDFKEICGQDGQQITQIIR